MIGHMPHTAHPDLIGSREAADLLHISQRTLHRRVTAGIIKPAYIAPGGPAGVYLFTRADIEAASKAAA